MKLFIYLFALVSLGLFSILPFFNQGFFSMHDDTQVARVHQMTQAIADGMFPVRWVKDLGFGYGYPIFNFYAPLPYYVGSLFTIFSSNALLATKASFVFAIVLSGVTMFYFVQSFFSRTSALVSGLVYLYFPYHAVNIYIRGNLNEVYAYAFLPLVLLGFFKLYYLEKSSKYKDYLKWIVLFGASIALVVVSHNLTALMLGFILSVLSIILLFTSKNKLRLLSVYIISGVLALGLSAFYWVPAIFEMGYTNVMSQVGGTADYRDHFVCLSQLWNGIWGFGGSGPGCVDGMSFKLGKINVLFTAISVLLFSAILFLKVKTKYFVLQFSMLYLLFFSVFMTLPYSKLVWDLIPGLEFLQFPWRFLNFAALGISFATGLIVYYVLLLLNKKLSLFLALLIIAATIFFNYKLFVPQTYYHERDNFFYSDREYINFEASSLTFEYMPKDFRKPESKSDVPQNVIQVEDGSAKVSINEYKTGYLSADIESNSQMTLHLNIAYFPSWQIFVDGSRVIPKTTDNGMHLEMGEGRYSLEAKFMQTTLQKTSNIVSIVSLITLATLLIYTNRVHKTKN